ncbi:GNAT family N-acetyltransferase [Streptomyces ziwulingensis]|uniref:GNAT family N-acetyltransferase n=1 Tax=Streptomyces ziwulingensis TaxID=1045501 RepID=UPI0031EDF386
MPHASVHGALVWERSPENDITAAGHRSLHRLLTESFPYTSEQFTGGRSWAGARPERRVTAWLDGRPVAHAGLLRRFLRIGSHEQLIGEVGLVAVAPALQGTGVGRSLAEHVRACLVGLGVPFGYLNCHDSVLGYYKAVGWQRLEGTRTRHCEPGDELTAVTTTAHPMILPLGPGGRKDWPAGSLIERDGTEL